MRTLVALLFALPALGAFGNNVNYTAQATQTGRPIEIHRTFAVDEICDNPRPYVGGVAVTQWQANVSHRWPASSLCPSGSVRVAFIAYHQDVTNTTAYSVDFRNSTDACYLGNLATCEAAAYNQAGMLGRSWEATMEVSAWPASTTATTQTINARTMMAAGKWSYLWLKGPLVTRVLVEDRSTARAYDFGFRETRAARLTGTLASDGTTFSVGSVDWSGVARPFKVEINYEIISVCYASYDALTGNTSLVVGTTSGISAACASFAGRGQDGTGPYNHYNNELRENVRIVNSPIRYVSGMSNGQSTALTVNDASSINDATLLKANFEIVRVCNKSGNTLTVGTGAWGCSASSNGRAWLGSRYAGQVQNSDGQGFPNGIGLDNWSTLTDVWTDATTDRYKSLHPVFVLTFWNNWSAVGIEYHLANVWSDRLQDQYYTAVLKRSGGTTVTTATALIHKAMTMWKYPDGPIVGTYASNLGDRKVWDGTAPAAMTWDYNLNYMRYSGVVPYDTSVTINSTAIGTLVGSTNRSTSIGTTWGWLNSDKAALPVAALWPNQNTQQNCASVTKALGGEGGRSDIAPAPLWHGVALYAMASALSGADMWPMGLYGNAGCSGYMPYHIWEGNTSASSKFCYTADATPYKSCTGANANVPAFGYPWSIDARPGACQTFGNCATVADRLLFQGDQSYANWDVGDGNAHWPQQNFIPWVLSGDWYYERGMLDEGAFSLLTASGNPAGRNYSWGWPTYYNMTRTISWFLRTISLAAWASPNGTPEEQYFTAKLQNWVAIEEGRYNMQTGSYYQPCPNTMWCWGRETLMKSSPENVNSIPGLGNVASWGWNDFGNTNPQYVYHIKSYWMDNFGVASISWAINLGYTFFRPLFNAVYYRDITDRILISGYNPYTNGEYRDPFIPCRPQGVAQAVNCDGQTFGTGVQRFYDQETTPEAAYGALMASWNSTAANRTAFINDADEQGGYSTIFWSAAQGAGQVRTGTNGARSGYHAQEWLKFNMCCRNGKPTGTPMYTFDPTEVHTMRLSAYPSAGGNLTFVFNPPNGAGCTYYLNTTPPASSLTTGETSVAAGALSRKVVLTGESAGTKYLRVTCGDTARTPTITFTQN